MFYCQMELLVNFVLCFVVSRCGLDYDKSKAIIPPAVVEIVLDTNFNAHCLTIIVLFTFLKS